MFQLMLQKPLVVLRGLQMGEVHPATRVATRCKVGVLAQHTHTHTLSLSLSPPPHTTASPGPNTYTVRPRRKLFRRRACLE